MTTVKQSYRFPGGTGASTVYYTMTSGSSNVTVTPASGTVTPGTTVEFTFQYASEADFTTQHTLVTWDNVCETPISKTFSISNPCSTLSLSIGNTPSSSNPFIFVATPSGGTPGYSVTWSYNTTLFNLVSQARQSIELSLKPLTAFPQTTNITATVTDSNGCSETTSFSYALCSPTATNQFVTAHCITQQPIGGITAKNGATATLVANPCSGKTINWDTLTLSYDTTKLYVTNDDNVLTIYGVAPATQTTYNITYSVADNYGFRSNDATVTVSLPTCSIAVAGPSVAKSSTKLPAGYSSGTTVSLALESITFDS